MYSWVASDPAPTTAEKKTPEKDNWDFLNMMF